MADSKISALTSGNPAQSGDEIPIARGGANYKITAGSIASLGGDVDGPASSVDNQIALFDSTTGKLIKAATTTGVLKASSGVIAAATSGTDYIAPAGTFSGLSWQSVQTTGFTAVAFRAYPCNTTSAAFTVTLPASPSAGDQITLTDYAGTWNTNPITISPNGGKIYGGTGNLISSTQRGAISFVYVDSTQGWITSSGLSQNPFLPAPSTVEYLIIGGGGGGSSGNDGGGGAGGYRTNSSLSVSQGVSYTLTIGAGGTGFVSPSGPVTAGSASSMSGPAPFTTISSAGGGQAGAAGGSGGGGTSFPPNAGGAGNTPATTPSQGNTGGSGNGGVGPGYTGGGGGGAGGVGSNGTSTTGGAGGPGSASTITGPSVTRAGGGGGGSRNGIGFGGAAGSGGGGAGGGTSAEIGGAGTANTGGGGGAGGFTAPNNANGGNGGSGVIIIAYPNTNANLASIGGGLTYTLDTTTRSGYKVYTFTAGTGTISW